MMANLHLSLNMLFSRKMTTTPPANESKVRGTKGSMKSSTPMRSGGAAKSLMRTLVDRVG